MHKNLLRRQFLESCVQLSALAFYAASPISAFSRALAGSQFSGSSALPDLERITALLKDKGPIIWVFTGDSITHGAKHTHGHRSYPEIFAERIKWELSRYRDVIINTGISGNTTKTILDDFDFRVRQFKPQVVSLMFGTNDCATGRIAIDVYEKNLYTLVNDTRALNAIPILHTPNLIIIEKDPSRARLEEYVAVIRTVAAKERVVLVDNYKYWQDTFKNNTDVHVFKNWLNDPLHPNGEGHVQIARLLFKELSIFNPKDPTCGAAYYEGEH
ncbi:MAG: SGNH/GDSL hydrolase family protein [Chitinophagaceae bacterium]